MAVPAYFIENFGCRATQADGEALERQLMERGFSRPRPRPRPNWCS
jgi:hypothetical protein